MIELLHENFVVILLVLFIGVMFWAFKSKKKIEKQRDKDDL
jgi:cbb3-type cytochrome oxidase subunit 3